MTQGNEEHISLRISHCPPQPILHPTALFKTFKASHFLQGKIQFPYLVGLWSSSAFSPTCVF